MSLPPSPAALPSDPMPRASAPITPRESDLIANLAFFENRAPQSDDFLADVLEGFAKTPKSLSPKYFYDTEGARLFEAICETREYYITRAEMALLRSCADEIAEAAGAEIVLVEFGSGALKKIRILLEALRSPRGLIAIDISRAQLIENAARLAEDFPACPIGAICADFTKPVSLLKAPMAGRRIGFLPGSTIGNLSPDEGVAFLSSVRQSLGEAGALLIGVDLKKSARRLEAAYNDRGGLTAAFNLNILKRIARELHAEIFCESFVHEAFYNEAAGRVEMHLRATKPQVISLNGRSFQVKEGERIHTENSYKYEIGEFHALSARAGFRARGVWTDSDHLFSLHWLEAA